METLRVINVVQELKSEAQRRESSYSEHVQEGFLEEVGPLGRTEANVGRRWWPPQLCLTSGLVCTVLDGLAEPTF